MCTKFNTVSAFQFEQFIPTMNNRGLLTLNAVPSHFLEFRHFVMCFLGKECIAHLYARLDRCSSAETRSCSFPNNRRMSAVVSQPVLPVEVAQFASQMFLALPLKTLRLLSELSSNRDVTWMLYMCGIISFILHFLSILVGGNWLFTTVTNNVRYWLSDFLQGRQEVAFLDGVYL
jgi:hypothetical protein